MNKLFLKNLCIGGVFILFLQGCGAKALFQQGQHKTLHNPSPDIVSEVQETDGIGSRINAPKRAISLAIRFQKNSYNLTTEAENMLNALGKALNKKRLKKFKFTIQGHTDASGPAQYNMVLSKKRSNTVKEFLVTKHNIDPDRLMTEGKGETELCDENYPYSGVNRRVKIINEGY